MSVELECAGLKGSLESGDKLAAEDTAEHFDGKEERAAGGDPAGVIWGEAAGGKHAVDMGMILQSLVPGMEHTEEADLGSNVPGIAGDLQQGFGAGAKQQVVDQTLVLQCERSHLVQLVSQPVLPTVPGQRPRALAPGAGTDALTIHGPEEQTQSA